MTIDRIIALISTVSLAYFAYGTWRIDRTLTRVQKNLEDIRDSSSSIDSTLNNWPHKP